MSILESSQIFFYISIGVCAIVLSIIYIIKTVIISKRIKDVTSKISNIVDGIEAKIDVARKFIDSIKENLSDAKFYLDKIQKMSEYFIDFKNDDNDSGVDDDGYEYVVKKDNKKKIRR